MKDIRTARRLADGLTARCRVKIDGECVVCIAKFDVEIYHDHEIHGSVFDSYATAASIYLSEKSNASSETT